MRFTGFILCLLLSAGCAYISGDGGFLSQDGLVDEGPYFKQQYIEPHTEFMDYKKVRIAPVNLRYLENEDILDPDLVVDLSHDFKVALVNELSEEFRVLSENELPDAETLVIKPALISLHTPNRAANVFTSLIMLMSFSNGSATFAAEIVDGESDKLLMQVAEKRVGSTEPKPFVLGGFSKRMHIQSQFRKWGENLRLMLQEAKQNYAI